MIGTETLRTPEQILDAIMHRRPSPFQRSALDRPKSEQFRHIIESEKDPIRRARMELTVAISPDIPTAALAIASVLEEEQAINAAAMTANLAKRDALVAESGWLDRIEKAVLEFDAWMQLPYRLEPVDASVFHKAFAIPMLAFTTQIGYVPPEPERARLAGCTVFLVQHDWAQVLDGAQVDAGALRLPFEYCCFEFAVAGRRVCLLVGSENGEPQFVMPILQTSAGWVVQAKYTVTGCDLTIVNGSEEDRWFRSVVDSLFEQVRAIAITLDAEVVTAEPVRAPYRLNAARLKNGHPPIYDHHVLSLARKTRVAPLERHGEPTGFHKRLHFRRGHWRHYASHKTWIRWMLVGDPSLGFADKDYRL